ncbi:hypothetical protein LTR36_007770 [Oleoguttula mirabilis]|uniref:Uncharacterized protein n=1 Tax=Oleoguttula mirabilis TaxID=1507867 RepID=A0AAV9J9R3_9PEZI|nr:hypothetical protein LTR36_007770 [Oleoguttula mirabilis]
MHRFISIVSALAALATAQNSTITSSVSYDPVATPDTLPIDDLRDFEVPTYTSIQGLSSQNVAYATSTAIASASIEQSESPLSVFPAVTSVAINAAGDSNDDSSVPSATDAVEKRALSKRTACAPQATMSNFYNVNVNNYSAFKADATISSVANAAATPSGYFQNFQNLPGASNAYAYLGYSVISTGYDVNSCATKCTAKSGCLAFNIYFERDPTVAPGTGCTNPAAFANIKCSFWGSALDGTTANNYGQWQSSFEVGIAGSNGYTSYEVGGPIDGWSTPQSLNNSAMNAPLRDCAGAWTYMGYTLFQSGPFDPRLCSAACNAQTAYDMAHPPSAGQPAKCAAFGTYLLTMTNKTGSYLEGQMCTLYTSNWDKDGSDFCTSYIGYSAPSTTTILMVTPAVSTDLQTTTLVSTVTDTSSPTATVTGNVQWKRDALNETISYTTVSSVPPHSVILLATYASTFTVTNGTVPTHAPSNIVARNGTASTSAMSSLAKRDTSTGIATPTSIAAWPASRISEACSEVATGTSTITAIVSLTASTTTAYSTVAAITTLQACVVPSELPDYETFIALFGVWDGDLVGNNPSPAFQAAAVVQLPFSMTMGGLSSNVVTVNTDGSIYFGDVQIKAFSGQGYTIYVYAGINGIYYRITGDVGSRQLVFAWYVGTHEYGNEQNHFTITYFENKPNEVQY